MTHHFHRITPTSGCARPDTLLSRKMWWHLLHSQLDGSIVDSQLLIPDLLRQAVQLPEPASAQIAKMVAAWAQISVVST
ncbi:uncharacterized protein J3R85_015298 [Psidium guajava]|nr:uncharacterized protein J3R85_015298 [Psidium guajava]